MLIKDGDCTKCPHWVRIDEKSEDRVCEFDGECENMIKEQTNEEWFCSLSTEEKAKFFDKICYSAWGDKSRFRDMCCYEDWVEWLKEKHTNGVQI